MAVSILQALFLVESWREGAHFGSTLTLGRIGHLMSRRDLKRVARLLPKDSEFVHMVERGEVPQYSEELFRALGATRVDAMDASAFEGATILQDLNEALAPGLRGQFDTVVDSGTLEHVFNVPAAFKNAMDALKVGGHFFAGLPANNWCGHGFYQFSAEFFYRVFSEENGFQMRKLFVAPAWSAGRWLDGPAFEVFDPKEMQERVEIEGKALMSFLVHAQKVREEVPFAKWPQQSDYLAAWARGPADQRGEPGKPTLFQYAGKAYRRIVRYLGSVGRVAEQTREKRIWTRQCVGNPALKPHKWIA
jgi:SAM-dependent methyltransferase